MEELVSYLNSYFHSRKIKAKHWDIIDIWIQSKTEFTIILRNVGMLIGKDGYRIKDMQEFISEKYKTEIKINAKKHTEWFENY